MTPDNVAAEGEKASERVTRNYLQRCPVCEGHGIVPQGFYLYPTGQPFLSTSTRPEQCRTCYGHGVYPQTEVVTR